MIINKINLIKNKNNTFGNATTQNNPNISNNTKQPITHVTKPVETNDSFQKTNNFDYVYNFDIDYSKSQVLLNNLQVIFDTNLINQDTYAQIELKPTSDFEAKSGVKEILPFLISEKNSNLYNSYEKNLDLPKVYLDYNEYTECLLGTLDKYYRQNEKGIEKMADFILAPNFTQEELQEAKTNIKKHLQENSSSAICKLDASVPNSKETISSSDVDSITLEDVNAYYNQFLKNSKGKIAITMPENTYSITKDKISSILSSKIPTLKTQGEKTVGKDISPILENKTYKGKDPYNSIEYEKIYVTKDNNTLKEDILNTIVDRVYYYSDTKSKIETRIYTQDYGNGNKITKIYASPSHEYEVFNKFFTKKPTAEELKAFAESRISYLINNPIDNKTLDVIKKELKELKIKRHIDQYFRTKEILTEYSDADGSLSKYCEELDKITSLDVQNTAKQIFSQNFIEAIDE